METYSTDEERVEALKKWWKENGMSLLFGVVIGLGAVFGWRYWVAHKQTQSEAASLTTMNLLANLNRAKPDVIIKHGETIKKDFSSTPYAVISSLAMAKARVKQGDLGAARKHLEWALQNAGIDALKHIIRIRLVRVLIAQGKLAEAQTLLNSVKPGKFVAAYEEQKGNIFRKQGKNRQALAAWKRALKALPEDARIRAILQLKIDALSVSGKES